MDRKNSLAALDHGSIVPDECEWRKCPDVSEHVVRASRWRAFKAGITEARAESDERWYVIVLALRTADISLKIDGVLRHAGIVTPGMLQVSCPGGDADCKMSGSYDFVHLHVPTKSLERFLDAGSVTSWRNNATERGFVWDRASEHLGRTLIAANSSGNVVDPFFLESVSTALIARVVSAYIEQSEKAASPHGLVKWRLMKALDYIEKHLGSAIGLTDISEVAGLNSAYFAEQFKVSIGLSPYDYVLRRRIERAQELLLDDASLQAIGAAVGFKTQSHFTTAFSKVVGASPQAWRKGEGGR